MHPLLSMRMLQQGGDSKFVEIGTLPGHLAGRILLDLRFFLGHDV